LVKKKSRGLSRDWGMGCHPVEWEQKATGRYAKHTRGTDLSQLEIEKTMQYGCTHITEGILLELADM